MPDDQTTYTAKPAKPHWYRDIRQYERPVLKTAIWQLANTFVPYFAFLYLMHLALRSGYSYWVVLALAVPAAGLLGRIFIFFHDCVHTSFFASRRANAILGHICGVFAFTPYDDWRRAHAIHHRTVGDLDNRGVGDVWTLTVDEYLAAPRPTRLMYRLYRNPFILLGLGPGYEFIISHRFFHRGARKGERNSVYINNLAIIAIVVAAGLTIGLWEYLQIQLPILLICGLMAVWVFYVQHQFVGVTWFRQDDKDPIRVALESSSHYQLPAVLRWFSGNIGYHHIHHLRPRIPNYRLKQCYDETLALQGVPPLTIRKSLKSPFLSLWDEAQKKIVGFGSLKNIMRRQTQGQTGL